MNLCAGALGRQAGWQALTIQTIFAAEGPIDSREINSLHG